MWLFHPQSAVKKNLSDRQKNGVAFIAICLSPCRWMLDLSSTADVGGYFACFSEVGFVSGFRQTRTRLRPPSFAA